MEEGALPELKCSLGTATRSLRNPSKSPRHSLWTSKNAFTVMASRPHQRLFDECSMPKCIDAYF